jgi:hypothetical protein
VSSRLERKLREGVEGYDVLPSDFRTRFEAALAAAKDTLSIAEEIKVLAPGLGRIWIECALAVISEGAIGGNWNKVHVAMAAAAPRLYPYVDKLIPRSNALSDVGL